MAIEPRKRVVRARQLREERSPPEAVFWNLVRNRRLGGLKFRRQHPLGPYTVDFFCPEAAMVIELDGEIHLATVKQDRVRDAWLTREGFLVVRIAVSTFMKDPKGMASAVGRVAKKRIEELQKAGQ